MAIINANDLFDFEDFNRKVSESQANLTEAGELLDKAKERFAEASKSVNEALDMLEVRLKNLNS